MALFEQFPYTNFHEMNMDWILQRLKALETVAETVADVYVVFEYSGGSYSKILGKTASELYTDITDGKNVKGVIITSDSIEYACKVTATKVLSKAVIGFEFAPEISASLTPGQIAIAYGRKVTLTQAMPKDSVVYTDADVEVAIES